MLKRLLFSVLIALTCTSCLEDDFIRVSPQLVVEGWIDADGFPVVILTTTVPIDDQKQDVSSLENYLVKWAKVTVSDGEQEVVLTGKVQKDHFPPYIYTTGHLRGVAGKSYRLTVSYNDYYAEATATIPHKVRVDSFTVQPLDGDSGHYSLTAHFKDNPREKNYYKFFISSSQDFHTYASARLSLVNDEVLKDSLVTTPIYRERNILHWEDYEGNFLEGETVKVKFAHIDEAGFHFWKSYEEVYSLARNPLFPLTEGLTSNVNGALGYWLGYGAEEYLIDIK